MAARSVEAALIFDGTFWRGGGPPWPPGATFPLLPGACCKLIRKAAVVGNGRFLEEMKNYLASLDHAYFVWFVVRRTEFKCSQCLFVVRFRDDKIWRDDPAMARARIARILRDRRIMHI